MIKINFKLLIFILQASLSQNQEYTIFLTYVADSTPDSRRHFGSFLGLALTLFALDRDAFVST